MNSFEKSVKYERAIWGSKVLLAVMGMVSTVILLKMIPPQLWWSFRSCISPLYIYLVIHFIILAIAATSTFPRTSKKSSSDDNKTINSQKFFMDKNTHGHSHSIISWRSFHLLQEKKQIPDNPPPKTNSGEYPSDERIVEDGEEKTDDGFAGEEEASPETNLDEYSTLEATWKAIMERQGKGVLKCDTAPLRTTLTRADYDRDSDDRVKMDGEDGPEREMGLSRDKSISPEELNKRAEAFIHKVNNDMRLQRLESEQRFMDMVNRGL